LLQSRQFRYFVESLTKSEIAANRLVQNNRRSQGGKGLCTPNICMPCLVVLCFEKRCPKPNSVVRLNSKYSAPPKLLGWLRYCAAWGMCSLFLNQLNERGGPNMRRLHHWEQIYWPLYTVFQTAKHVFMATKKILPPAYNF